MEAFDQILESFGADSKAVLSVAMMVYLVTAVIRAKLPAKFTDGGKSTLWAVGIALLATFNVIQYDLGLGAHTAISAYIVSIVTTATFGWILSYFIHEKLKGTKLEIKKESGRTLPGEKVHGK